MIDFGTENLVFGWLMNFLLHSSLLIGLAWGLNKTRLHQNAGLSETVWQTALVVGFLSATLALLPLDNPLSRDIAVERSPLLKEVYSKPANMDANTASNSDALPKGVDAITAVADITSYQAPKSTTKTRPLNETSDATNDATNSAHLADLSALWASLWPTSPLLQMVLWWAVIVLMLIGHLYLTYRHAVKTVGSRIVLAADHRAWQLLNQLVQRAELSHMPRLTVSQQLVSPFCLPGNEICLPQWALDELGDDQIESMLAHELGHLVRRDPRFFLLMQSLERIFFFQPLLRLAHQRLRVLAELAADEWAAGQTKNAQAVATTLYACAEKLTHIHKQPESRQLGIAMAHNKTLLKTRIERLVRAKSLGFKNASLVTKGAALAVMAGLALSMPNFQLTAATPVTPKISGDSTSIRLRDEDGTSRFTSRDGHYEIDAKWSGKLVFNDTFDAIVDLGSKAFFELNTDDGDMRRSLELHKKNGKMVTRYQVDGDDMEMDAAGREWARAAIADMVLRSGMYVDERVERLLKKGGVDAVFAEMDKMPTDYTLRKMAVALVEKTDLSAKQLVDFANHTKVLDSDYETRVILASIFEHQKVTGDTLPHILKMAEDLDSDYEKRQILTPVLENYPLNEMTNQIIVKMAETIDSDYELRQILTRALARDDVTDDAFENLIAIAAKNIESDYEMRQIVLAAGENLKDKGKALGVILDHITLMDSDYEKRQVIIHLAENTVMSNDQWQKLIRASGKLDSGYERGQSLLAIMKKMPKDKAVTDTFEEAMAGLESDHEYGKVSRAYRQYVKATK